MSQFAFQVSWPDLIRKIGYRYEHPVDYVSFLIGQFYDPGARVDLTVDPSTIKVESDSPTDPFQFDQALKGSPLDSTFVIPPVTEYAIVRIVSGRRGIVVDQQRAIHRADPDEYYYGTIITIQRDQNVDNNGGLHVRDVVGVVARLTWLYWGSDLRVTVNGRALYTQAYTFKTGSIEGAISYDATHEGGIRYYVRGRFIERDPFIDGVNVLVHRHPFPTTLTSSHLIRSGEQHLQIQRQLPDIMAGYLESPAILELARRNPTSCRVLCETILARFPEDRRIRSLADRLAHSEGARVPGLASPRQRGSTAPPVSTGARASTRGLPMSVKLLILCTLAALCLGVWRHSQTDRPPSVAQTAPEPVESPKVRGSTPSTPNPGRSAPGSEKSPGDVAPGPTSNLKPSDPESVGSVRDSAQAGDSDRTGQNPVTPPGDSVSQPTSGLDGGSFTTPPVDRFSGPMPGLAYRSSGELAEYLKHLEEEAEKRGTSQDGYAPGSTFNVLTMSGGQLEWSNRSPDDTLVDTVQHPVWPPDFAHISGHADGIRAVRSYLDGFSYGAIPPAVRRKYPDDLSAILGERSVDCTGSNTLAAHLLYELGYRKVIAVTGTHGGCLHTWLSVWEGGRWRTEDFTPARMSPDFARACSAYSVKPPSVPMTRDSSDASAPGAAADSDDSVDPDTPPTASGAHSSPDRPADQLASTIFFDLCIILAVFYLAYSTASFALRNRATAATAAAGQWTASAEMVRDLLGVAAVRTGSESAYDHPTRTLTLDEASLYRDGPFISAVKAVPLISKSQAQQEALYRRLSDRALR